MTKQLNVYEQAAALLHTLGAIETRQNRKLATVERRLAEQRVAIIDEARIAHDAAVAAASPEVLAVLKAGEAKP